MIASMIDVVTTKCLLVLLLVRKLHRNQLELSTRRAWDLCNSQTLDPNKPKQSMAVCSGKRGDQRKSMDSYTLFFRLSRPSPHLAEVHDLYACQSIAVCTGERGDQSKSMDLYT